VIDMDERMELRETGLPTPIKFLQYIANGEVEGYENWYFYRCHLFSALYSIPYASTSSDVKPSSTYFFSSKACLTYSLFALVPYFSVLASFGLPGDELLPRRLVHRIIWNTLLL